VAVTAVVVVVVSREEHGGGQHQCLLHCQQSMAADCIIMHQCLNCMLSCCLVPVFAEGLQMMLASSWWALIMLLCAYWLTGWRVQVMGIDKDFASAYAKAQIAAGQKLPTRGGKVFLTMADKHKKDIVPIARDLGNLGYGLVATSK
jgi:hypothetical protein